MTSSGTSERGDRADASTAAESAAARVARNTTRAEVAASLFGEVAPVVVGRFELGRCIGRGSMGKVYEAFDPTLERKVALKVIAGRPGISAERLLDEARALARLEHPHVVTIHEAGVTSDGVVHCAMALLDGDDLRTKWRRERAPRAEVLATVQAIASALGALHERGVVHRDVKPENVVMVEARPVLVDFGVARQTRAAGGEVERGYPVAGTPGYMAPEQRAGEPGDSRSDQYALAMLAAEGLFGERPGDAGDGVTSAPGGAEHDPLWPVLARALSAAPHDRFPTVLAFADALGRETPRPSKSRVVMGVGFGALVVLGLGLYGRRPSEAPRSVLPLMTSVVLPFAPPQPDLGIETPSRAEPRALIRRALERMKQAGPPGAELVEAKFPDVRDGRVDVTQSGPGAEVRFEWIDPADPTRHGGATVGFRGGRIELEHSEGPMFYRGRRFDRYFPLAPPACSLADAMRAAKGLEGRPRMVSWGMRYARSDEGHLTWHIHGRRGAQWHVDAATCVLVERLD